MALDGSYGAPGRRELSEVGCSCSFVDATARKAAGRTGAASWRHLPCPLRPVSPCPLLPAFACSPRRPPGARGPPRGRDRGSPPFFSSNLPRILPPQHPTLAGPSLRALLSPWSLRPGACPLRLFVALELRKSPRIRTS